MTICEPPHDNTTNSLTTPVAGKDALVNPPPTPAPSPKPPPQPPPRNPSPPPAPSPVRFPEPAPPAAPQTPPAAPTTFPRTNPRTQRDPAPKKLPRPRRPSGGSRKRTRFNPQIRPGQNRRHCFGQQRETDAFIPSARRHCSAQRRVGVGRRIPVRVQRPSGRKFPSFPRALHHFAFRHDAGALVYQNRNPARPARRVGTVGIVATVGTVGPACRVGNRERKRIGSQQRPVPSGRRDGRGRVGKPQRDEPQRRESSGVKSEHAAVVRIANGESGDSAFPRGVGERIFSGKNGRMREPELRVHPNRSRLRPRNNGPRLSVHFPALQVRAIGRKVSESVRRDSFRFGGGDGGGDRRGVIATGPGATKRPQRNAFNLADGDILGVHFLHSLSLWMKAELYPDNSSRRTTRPAAPATD